MSRLYYDIPANDARFAGGNDRTEKTKEYLDKVSRLVPAEILAAYMAIIGLIPAIHNELLETISFILAFVGGIVGTPFYMSFMADENRPKRIHIIVSTAAFILWAYIVSGHLIPNYYNPAFGSILLIIFTAGSGKIPLN